MPNIQEKLLAIKSEQLPEYLASLGLNPYQITSVVYGIFREIKILGKLTPGEDNSIHLDKEKLLKMAKDPALESDLYSLFLKVQRNKNWEPLFKKEKTETLVAPDVRHNPHDAKVELPKGGDQDSIEVVDFMKFLSACGIDNGLIIKAIEEKKLLEGSKK